MKIDSWSESFYRVLFMVRREVLYVLPRPEEHKSVKAPGGQRHLLRKHWPPTASPAQGTPLGSPCMGEPGACGLCWSHHDCSRQDMVSVQQASGERSVSASEQTQSGET